MQTWILRMSSGNRSENICRDISYFSPIIFHLVVNYDKLFYSLIFFYFYLYFLFLPFWRPPNFMCDSWFTKTLVTSKKEMRLLIFMTSTHASSTEGRGQVRKEILVLQNISSERLYASDESSIWIGPSVLIYMFNICIPWAVKGRFMRKGRLAYSDSCAKGILNMRLEYLYFLNQVDHIKYAYRLICGEENHARLSPGEWNGL